MPPPSPDSTPSGDFGGEGKPEAKQEELDELETLVKHTDTDEDDRTLLQNLLNDPFGIVHFSRYESHCSTHNLNKTLQFWFAVETFRQNPSKLQALKVRTHFLEVQPGRTKCHITLSRKSSDPIKSFSSSIFQVEDVLDKTEEFRERSNDVTEMDGGLFDFAQAEVFENLLPLFIQFRKSIYYRRMKAHLYMLKMKVKKERKCKFPGCFNDATPDEEGEEELFYCTVHVEARARSKLLLLDIKKSLDNEEDEKLLHTVCTHPVGSDYFASFLMKEFSIENLNFLQEVTSWAKSPTDIGAIDLFNVYITEDAPSQVNINHATRTSISKALSNIITNQRESGGSTLSLTIDVGTFDEARKEIFQLLLKDSFRRFKQQSAFSTCMRAIKTFDAKHARLRAKMQS